MDRRLLRVTWPGKQRRVDVIVSDVVGEPLVHYGDVCWVLPSSWRAPISPDRVVLRYGQAFVRASDLRRQTSTDTQEAKVRTELAAFLDQMELEISAPTGASQ